MQDDKQHGWLHEATWQQTYDCRKNFHKTPFKQAFSIVSEKETLLIRKTNADRFRRFDDILSSLSRK